MKTLLNASLILFYATTLNAHDGQTMNGLKALHSFDEIFCLSISVSEVFEKEDRRQWLRMTRENMILVTNYLERHRNEIFATRTHAENDLVSNSLSEFRSASNSLVDSFGIPKALTKKEINDIIAKFQLAVSALERVIQRRMK